ncbi:acyl carrier protein [Candidatus Binatus sp.]|uniref:acyl carrier protein n=1 Tax=Candidatus Binatus sp. TaxID=2811406 RepID=UPI003CC68C11
MTNDAILEKVRNIVAEVSEVEVERVSLQSSPDNLEEWDSLAQVNIVLSLEQEFGHQFSPEQIESMVSVEKIVEVLTARAA